MVVIGRGEGERRRDEGMYRGNVEEWESVGIAEMGKDGKGDVYVKMNVISLSFPIHLM